MLSNIAIILKEQITQVKNSEFARSFLTLFTGTAISQLITVLISPVLSRIYTPTEYGQLAVFLGLGSILCNIVTGRYELSIMLPKKKKEAVNILSLSILLSLSVCLFLELCFVSFKSFITKSLSCEEIGNLIYLVPLFAFFSSLTLIFNMWLVRADKYKSVSFANINTSYVQAGSRLGLGFARIPGGLIMGSILGQLSGVSILIFNSLKKKKYLLKFISIREIQKLAKRYSSFPKFQVFSGLLNTFSVQLPVFMITKYFSADVCGNYSQANNILTLPLAFIGTALGQAYFRKASTYIDDPDRLKTFTFTLFKKLLLLGIAPMIIIGLWGKEIFMLVLGRNWESAGLFAEYLWVWLLFVFISSPLSYIFYVLEKQKENVIFNVLMLLSRFLAIYIGAIFIKDPTKTILFLGIVGGILYCGYSLYMLKLVGINYRKSLLFLTKFCIPVVILLILFKIFL